MSDDENFLILELADLGLIDDIKRVKAHFGERFNPNIQDNGSFPALIAAQRNDLEMLKLLVEYGAKLNTPDGRGRTVFDWACRHKNEAMIEFIKQNLDLNDPLIVLELVRTGQCEIVKKLLKENTNPNIQNSQKTSPALIAAQKNDLEMLKLLVKYGAKLDLQDCWGRTVSEWAEKHQNREMIEFIDNVLIQ